MRNTKGGRKEMEIEIIRSFFFFLSNLKNEMEKYLFIYLIVCIFLLLDF